MGEHMKPCHGYRANAFLGSLGHADLALLEPFFEETHYRSGDRLDAAGSDRGSIVFPISLVISIGLRSHESAVGLVGREGLVGWSALLSCGHLPQQSTVLLDGGSALAIPVERMREAFDRSPTLAFEMLHFASVYIDQMSLTASAMTCATLRERLAAWMLMLHDRIEGDFIRITHKLLATHLGVRRASITDLL
ncbi:MAG: Crp/Fnr family transcriptional regulator, partial [Erythrobacter sp.]|nr:Crp/Fnr family transcriptional regulator [Erythrobacter sp.]